MGKGNGVDEAGLDARARVLLVCMRRSSLLYSRSKGRGYFSPSFLHFWINDVGEIMSASCDVITQMSINLSDVTLKTWEPIRHRPRIRLLMV